MDRASADDGGSHVGSTDTAQIYSNYSRNYRAVGVMWGIFTICFAIINIIVFLLPQWVGDTPDSPGRGWVGLYQHCEIRSGGGVTRLCKGSIGSFDGFLSDAFVAATFFVGFSALLELIVVCCTLLFPFIKTPSVLFMVCGWIQVVSGLCMFLGCLVFPLGWDNPQLERVCGKDVGQFSLGACGVRWAYILAIIGIFDAFILAILAFVLATKYIPRPMSAGVLTKSDLNGYLAAEPEPRAVQQKEFSL